MLFNEPKLLKSSTSPSRDAQRRSFSALQRAEIAEIWIAEEQCDKRPRFSALQRAEIAEIALRITQTTRSDGVSVLFNEPKLLKCRTTPIINRSATSFSALQRAEIAEIKLLKRLSIPILGFSALQRAEIAEMCTR